MGTKVPRFRHILDKSALLSMHKASVQHMLTETWWVMDEQVKWLFVWDPSKFWANQPRHYFLHRQVEKGDMPWELSSRCCRQTLAKSGTFFPWSHFSGWLELPIHSKVAVRKYEGLGLLKRKKQPKPHACSLTRSVSTEKKKDCRKGSWYLLVDLNNNRY